MVAIYQRRGGDTHHVVLGGATSHVYARACCVVCSRRVGMVAPSSGATPAGSVGDRHRLMRPEEGADVAHRQRDLVRRVLPRVQAHLRVRRQMHGLHRDGVWVRRHVVWQARTNSRVTVYTKSARARYMLVRKVSTIAIVMSGRRAHSSGPQPCMLLV